MPQCIFPQNNQGRLKSPSSVNILKGASQIRQAFLPHLNRQKSHSSRIYRGGVIKINPRYFVILYLIPRQINHRHSVLHQMAEGHPSSHQVLQT